MPSAPSADPAASARRRYFPAVEGMRGVAAMTVLAGHAIFFGHPAGGKVAMLGFWLAEFGVAIFFGISGFLLYRPFVAARAHGPRVGEMTPSYLWRRAVRILPAYWVALTVLAIWPGLDDVFSGHWWAYYGLLQVYSTSFGGGLDTAWTLCVEVTFYLALPLLALVLAHRGIAAGRRGGIGWEVVVLGGLGLASIVAYGWVGGRPGVSFLQSTLVGTFTWFVWGMLLAAIQIGHPAAASRFARALGRPWVAWPLGLAIFSLMPLEAFDHLGGLSTQVVGAVQWFCLGLGAGCLLAPAMLGDSDRLVRALLANRVLVYLGTVSYGIYLWHYPIVRWLLERSFVLRSGSPALVTAVIAAAAAIALGSLSWFLVERPLMRRARSVKALARPSAPHPREPAAAPPAPVPHSTFRR